MRKVILSLLATALTMPAAAVPPPAPSQSQRLDLKADNCPIDFSGSARPYSPSVIRFDASADETLLMINKVPNPDLIFTLLTDDEAPLISGAGFGAGDVRIRLPRNGTYELQVSAFDASRMSAASADFKLRFQLHDKDQVARCPNDR